MHLLQVRMHGTLFCLIQKLTPSALSHFNNILKTRVRTLAMFPMYIDLSVVVFFY